MYYQHTMGLRYPKGPFYMATITALTGASILASIIFSLLLFLSIDDDLTMKWLFGALAVIFEVGKFYAWYEFGERKAHRNYTGALSALLFYSILALISIGGSIGGINCATNSAQEHVDIEQAKVNDYNRQIAAIDKQIALNNLAAQKYIEMERIISGVTRIQAENKHLREEQQKLAMERDSLPPVAQGSVIGLIDSLAKILSISSQTAQLGLVVFLSVLLDFLSAFFVGTVGEEFRFRHWFTVRQAEKKAEAEQAQHNANAAESQLMSPAVMEISMEQKVAQALMDGQIGCTKKAVAKHFMLHSDEVERAFSLLLENGYIGRKANNHYYLLEDMPS